MTPDIEPSPCDEAASVPKPMKPCAIVIFGATGDLTRRKLVPALYGLACDGLLPPEVAILGCARREKTSEEFAAELREDCEEHGRDAVDDECWERFVRGVGYVQGGFDDPSTFAKLGKRLEELDRDPGTAGNRLFYLAVPPDQFPVVLAGLDEAGLIRRPDDPAGFTRVVVEKPFGHDLESARALNAEVAKVLHESQVFRIDHYLGKETVQNILVFRLGNGIFEPLFNRRYVDHVQITVAESLGVGDRAGYFDRAGILRDMIQSHVLQLLTLVAMEPPSRFEADAVRDEKVKVLESIRPLLPDEVPSRTVRARYVSGRIGAEGVPGYLDEPNVPADSETETYAAVRFHVRTWRWSGVPFYLRVGKRLPRRATEISIVFRHPPLALFWREGCAETAENVLTLRIQPDEGITLTVGSKVPGPSIDIEDVNLRFKYATEFDVESPDAYERLLLDAAHGDGTLFARRDEVELGWELIDAIRRGWEEAGPSLTTYEAGTWGPPEAKAFMDGEGRRWRDP